MAYVCIDSPPAVPLLPIIPLADSFKIDPDVFPLSVLIIRSGSLLV
jgi:hypothetical protein